VAQEPAIAALAKSVLAKWKQACGHHLRVLLDPSFLADPRQEAQAILKAVADQVGSHKQKADKSLPAAPSTPRLTLLQQPSASGAAAAVSTGADSSAAPGAALPSVSSSLSFSALLPEGLQGGEAAHLLALLQEHAGESSVSPFSRKQAHPALAHPCCCWGSHAVHIHSAMLDA
jgi:hypothetical protein